MSSCFIVNETNSTNSILTKKINSFTPKYIVYHDYCPDGIASAWIAWKFYNKEPILIGSPPGKVPEEILSDTNARVLYVDLSPDLAQYPKFVLSRDLMIIDHHKSCYEQYSDFPGLVYGGKENKWSAARMCLDIFEYDETWVEFVSDRDTWRFELPDSDAVNEAIYVKDLLNDPETVDENLEQLRDISNLVKIGKLYLESKDQLVKKIAQKAQGVYQDDKIIAVVNSPIYQSDIGNYLITHERVDTAVIYYCQNVLESNDILGSVRSKTGTALPLAKVFDGGGHDNAAGFKTTLHKLRKKLNRSNSSINLQCDYGLIIIRTMMIIILIVIAFIIYQFAFTVYQIAF